MPSVGRAVYKAQVNWDKNSSGFFTLGVSALDGPDPLAASPFSVPVFDGDHDDVSAYILTLAPARGRSETLEQVQAGTISVELRDPGYQLDQSNRCLNPGFETDTAGWHAHSAGSAIARITSDHQAGAAALEVTTAGTTIEEGALYSDDGARVDVRPRETWILAAYVKGTAGRKLRLLLAEYNADGDFVRVTRGTDLTLSGSWQPLTVTAHVGPDAAQIEPYVLTAETVATTFKIDTVTVTPAANTRRPGLFNPKNEDSPLYPFTADPRREIKVQAAARYHAETLAVIPDSPYAYPDLIYPVDLVDTDWHGLFYGFTRDLEYEPQGRKGVCRVTADDLLMRLAGTRPKIPTIKATTTGAVIRAVLAAVGWLEEDFIDLADGDPVAEFSADGTATALELIAGVLAVELGVFYQDGDGVARYEDRNQRWTEPVAATIANSMRAIGPGASLDRIVNEATFTKEGSTPQTFTDEESAAFYDLRSAGEVTSPYLAGDSDALMRAQMIVEAKKDPAGPLWALTIDNRELGMLADLLALDFGDRVRVSEAGSATEEADYFIERVEHQMEARGSHSARYILSERGPDRFILGSSALDGPEILGL